MLFYSFSGPPALRLIFLLSVLFFAGPFSLLLRSQTDKHLWFEVQDSAFVDLINDDVGDTTNPDKVWPLYEFHMLYDSCRAIYTFTELKCAGARLKLDNWKYLDFKKNFDAATLSGMSHSKPFTVHAGDTLSFYREFAWFNPHTNEQKINNYFSEDDLEFVVRLKNTGTNATLARLDSLGIYSRVPSGVPYIYGNGPAYYIVKYIVPAAHNNKEVYVDIAVSANGTGDFDPARKDDFGINLSAAVLNDCWVPYFAQFGGAGAAASKSLQIVDPDNHLLRSTVDRASRTARIAVDEQTLAGRPLSLSIYRIDGTRVFVSSWAGGQQREVVHTFTESGSYVIALAAGNDLMATEKLNVP